MDYFINSDSKSGLRPEFFLFGGFHFSGTAWAGVFVPDPDVAAAAFQAQSAGFATEGRGYVGNDAADNDVLDGMAVGARHRRNLLIEQATTFIDFGFVAAFQAAVFEFG